MSLVIGWYFKLLRGTILVSFASTTGATMAFLLSRYLFRDAMQRKFGSRLTTFNEALDREGAFYLFTLRLISSGAVLCDQRSYGAYADTNLDLLVGQPSWHAGRDNRLCLRWFSGSGPTNASGQGCQGRLFACPTDSDHDRLCFAWRLSNRGQKTNKSDSATHEHWNPS